jgi:hypothetical protein
MMNFLTILVKFWLLKKSPKSLDFSTFFWFLIYLVWLYIIVSQKRLLLTALAARGLEVPSCQKQITLFSGSSGRLAFVGGPQQTLQKNVGPKPFC